MTIFRNILWLKIAIVLLLIGAWQAVGYVINNPILWPDFGSVVLKLFELLQQKTFLLSVASSLKVATLGFLSVMLLAFIIAIATYKIKFLKELFTTVSAIVGPTPTLSWLPVFLIFFGFTKTTLYFLIVWGVLWFILPNIYSLIEMSQAQWDRQIKNLGFNKFKAFRHVYLPSMVKGFISTGTVNFMQVWRVLFSIEIIFGAMGGHIGIGTTMYDFKGKFDHVEVYACLLMIMILGAILSTGLKLIEKKTKD